MALTDSCQNRVHISEKPQRVVSLVPYISEMLLTFGQEKVLVGLTRPDLILHSGIRKKNVGSYLFPSVEAIRDCNPDLMIAAPCHKEVIKHFKKGGCKLLVMETRNLEEAFYQMELMGRLFDCETEAAETIKRNREELALVKARLSALPDQRKKRVACVMGEAELECTGDDSFQNEMIAAAGGIPPRWGKTGSSVTVSQKAWQEFNPQVIYGCQRNEKTLRALLNRKGWKEVEAVKSGNITTFPCHLTSRISIWAGYFVQWLATVLYLDTFADTGKAVLKNEVLAQRPVAVDLPYVSKAQVVEHRVADAVFKSLVVRFKKPQDLLSTFEGYLFGVSAVGNTFVPMPASLGHMVFGVAQVQEAIRNNLGFAKGEFATLMTGADMDNLSVQKVVFNDLEVIALVTAGVRGNAMRASKDEGVYYQHGTINIIVLTNRRLTPNAMARAIIAATEAKSVALLDLDIRSAYNPLDFRASGTGTDNVLVVQGEGPVEHFAGGHTKMGELIARAVYAGVTEAIDRQNGIRVDRDVFQRLADRKLSLEVVVGQYPAKGDKLILASRLEGLLMDSYYASFLESALAISDEYQKGLIKDLTFFDTMCCSVVARLSGRLDVASVDIPATDALPVVMSKAFGALVTGITEKNNKRARP